MNETEKTSILIVDDRPEKLLALENLLGSPDLNIVKAASGNEALGLMLESDFALVLLDVQMPEMDGFETAERMRRSERTRQVPIIFVTAINKDRKHLFHGYETGAVDYLFKPLDPRILKSKVNVFLQLYKQKRSLIRANRELNQTLAELKKTNRTILEQQKSVIEEERLKVLLQMAGATAHELNQPLMGLLGYVDMIKIHKDNPEKLANYIEKIQEIGFGISDIVKKMQTIRQYETNESANNSSIINLDQKINMLSVEVSDDDFEQISRIISGQNKINMSRAKDVESAVELLGKNRFGLILLEVHLPDGSGLDFLRIINEKGFDIPVVVITGQGNEMFASRVIESGAYDYLPKDKLTEPSLSRVIAGTLEKARLKKEAKDAIRKMAEMSSKDGLTGLYNRKYFYGVLEREVSRATRYDTELVLFMLDLDNFKHINDTYGHSAGDMVLSKIGKMLKEWVRQSDLVCRYGGEEFAVILPHTPVEQAVGVCERFRKMLMEHTFEFHTSKFQMTVSIGIASIKGSKSKSPDELMRYTDHALCQAKELGRNRVVEYSINS